MTFTLCTQDEMKKRAGAYASTTVTLSDIWMQQIYDEVVGEVVANTNRDWATNYASVNAYKKEVLRMAVTARGAFRILSYDLKGFPTNSQGETILDVLDNDYNAALKILNDAKIIQALRDLNQ